VKRSHLHSAALAALLGSALALPASGASSARSSAAEAQFRAAQPCPATGLAQGACKGYVIDRIIPHICGGADEPANMQWLTLAEAKAKSRWDRIGCRAGRRLVLPGQATTKTEAFALEHAPEPVQSQPLRPGERPPAVTPEPPPADETEPELPHE
jgi:hypothetical protein